jgi:hypothetical protein
MCNWKSHAPRGTAAVAATIVVLGIAGNVGGQAAKPIRGSDTLFDIMNDAIAGAGLSGQLAYVGGGSSGGARALWATPAVDLSGTQLLAPMSRNFRDGEVPSQAAFDVHTPPPAPARAVAFPGTANVVGLDAVVILTQANVPHPCQDLVLPVEDDPNGEPGARRFVAGNDLQLILGGEGGTGTQQACSSPLRLAALDRLASCIGGPGSLAQIEHFYRRDNNSGTTDTIREKAQVAAFCNGAAVGPGNTDNADLDPIRRPCTPGSDAQARTRCTIFSDPARPACQDMVPLPADCTQGLVVALSTGEPAGATPFCQKGATAAIGCRVGLDGSGKTVGFAGLEGLQAPGTLGPTINGVSYTPANIRDAQQPYPLARRLLVQDRADPEVLLTGASGIVPAEHALLDWMRNRCNLDPIIVSRGFITCSDSCTEAPAPTTLCGNTPFRPAP